MEIHGKLVDVHSRTIFAAIITIQDGIIASIQRNGHRGDCFILPGFVDAYTHLTSSLLCPSEFAKLAVRHGTLGAALDKEAIEYMLGPPGLEYVLDNGNRSPLAFTFTSSMAIPSTFSEGRAELQRENPLVITQPHLSLLFPLIAEEPMSALFASNYLTPDRLLLGHTNLLVKQAISHGVDPIDAIISATKAPTEFHNLELGLLREGDPADFILVEDLNSLRTLECYRKGELIFRDEPLFTSHAMIPIDKFAITPKDPSDFEGKPLALISKLPSDPPLLQDDPGFNLTKGAIALSVGAPSHCIAAIGANPEDTAAAVNAIIEAKGGLALANKGKVDLLSLPIAGLFSNEDGTHIARKYSDMQLATRDFGCHLESPFVTLAQIVK